MKTTIKLWYEEKYLPNKRCRKLRERAVSKDVDIEVCEVTKEEFPVAFVVHDYESVYEGAKSYSDFEGNGDYRMFSEEIGKVERIIQKDPLLRKAILMRI